MKKNNETEIHLTLQILRVVEEHPVSNVISSEALEGRFQIPGGKLRAKINFLRNEGWPIGSVGGSKDGNPADGYFLAHTIDEIEPTQNEFMRVAMNYMHTARQIGKKFGGKQLDLLEELNHDDKKSAA